MTSRTAFTASPARSAASPARNSAIRGRGGASLTARAARPFALLTAALLLLLGTAMPANAAGPLAGVTPDLATTSVITVTASQYSYGKVSRATVTVRDKATHAAIGTANFALDGKIFARVKLDIAGRASATIPTASIGRHTITATYAPTPNTGHAASTGAKAIDVWRGNVTWGISIPATPVYAGNASINVTLRGFTAVKGQVSLLAAGKVVQTQTITPTGTVAFRVKANWTAGNAALQVSYSGSASFVPATKLVVVKTLKAPTAFSLSIPATLGYNTGGTASATVTGAGATPTGRVTVTVDGTPRSAKALAGGKVSLTIPGMSPGSHTVTTSYPGDANHSGSSKSATVKAASAPLSPCPVSARVCIDLTHSLTWLQSGGRITYGPVPMSSGRPGYRTEAGTFTVYWFDIDHHSSEFNNAPMPYSVFFDGGEAFHEGNVDVASHGCIHLNHDAAAYYYSVLNIGDQVAVFGYAPY